MANLAHIAMSTSAAYKYEHMIFHYASRNERVNNVQPRRAVEQWSSGAVEQPAGVYGNAAMHKFPEAEPTNAPAVRRAWMPASRAMTATACQYAAIYLYCYKNIYTLAL